MWFQDRIVKTSETMPSVFTIFCKCKMWLNQFAGNNITLNIEFDATIYHGSSFKLFLNIVVLYFLQFQAILIIGIDCTSCMTMDAQEALKFPHEVPKHNQIINLTFTYISVSFTINLKV